MNVATMAWATLSILFLGPPHGALAHEEAVLKSDQSSVAAGGTWTVRGEKFEEGEAVDLRLVGALSEYAMGKAVPDSAGVLSLDLTIPASVKPGAYRLVAIAPDGDEAASLDVTVLAAAVTPEGEEGAASSEAAEPPGGHGPTMARSDDIRIERDRSGLGWGIIGLLIGAAGGLGFGLVRLGRDAA
ncbi:MAG: hypothetical protein ACE5HQ_11055 [Gemmatimonadota bacterium]